MFLEKIYNGCFDPVLFQNKENPPRSFPFPWDILNHERGSSIRLQKSGQTFFVLDIQDLDTPVDSSHQAAQNFFGTDFNEIFIPGFYQPLHGLVP